MERRSPSKYFRSNNRESDIISLLGMLIMVFHAKKTRARRLLCISCESDWQDMKDSFTGGVFLQKKELWKLS
jgi:hypothetical protein